MSKRLGRIAIREQTLNHAQYEYERELEKKKKEILLNLRRANHKNAQHKKMQMESK